MVSFARFCNVLGTKPRNAYHELDRNWSNPLNFWWSGILVLDYICLCWMAPPNLGLHCIQYCDIHICLY